MTEKTTDLIISIQVLNTTQNHVLLRKSIGRWSPSVARERKAFQNTWLYQVTRNGSVGYCFYHPYDALYGNDTRKLKPIKSNKYVSLFISMCITNQRAKYGYGYKMGTGRLKRQKILLPIDSCNQPNWEYMEMYMQNLEQKQIVKYLNHVKNI